MTALVMNLTLLIYLIFNPALIMFKNKTLPGAPFPLGATWDGAGVNFT
jgi:hypothetical protein